MERTHLLRVEADDKGRHVDDLLADADVTLADQDAGVVDALGEARLEDLRLEAALHKVLDLLVRSGPSCMDEYGAHLEGEHVVEAHAGLVQHANADQPAVLPSQLEHWVREGAGSPNQGVALEETLRVLLVQLEQLTGGTANLGEDEGDAPNFALVPVCG